MLRLLIIATVLTILPAGTSNGASYASRKGAPVHVKRPVVLGSAMEGQQVTANRGTWRRATTYSFRWMRCNPVGGACSVIPGATGVRYLVTAREVRKTLRVTVTASNRGGSVRASSPRTSVVREASTVFARTTFERSVVIDPMSRSSWNQFQWLHNTDRLTGFNFDTSRYFGSRWGILSVICSGTGGCPSSGVSTDYISNTIEKVAGHSGSSTRALKLAFTGRNPNSCCQQVGLNSSSFTAAVRNYYMRAWVRLNPDIQAQADSQRSNYWRQFWVFKTTRDQRIDIKLLNHHRRGITWYVQSDPNGSNCSPCSEAPYWLHDSRRRVPSGRWFQTEIFFRRANDSSGRFFFAVDGQTIVDRRGPNLGHDQDDIAVISHAQVYSSFKTGGWQMVDDLEIRDRPPCVRLPCARRHGRRGK